MPSRPPEEVCFMQRVACYLIQCCFKFSSTKMHFSFELSACMCLCMVGCTMHKNAVSVRPEEGIESSGARVTGGCEPPDIGAQNRTRVH